MSTPLKVRGSCPDGHVIDATAPKGRTTWRGPCPYRAEGVTQDCAKPVVARRIPLANQAGAQTDTEVPPEKPDDQRGRVRKVHSYRDDPPTFDPPAPEPEEQPTPEPLDELDGDGGPPGVGGAPAAGAGSAAGGSDGDGTGGLRSRLRRRPRRQAGPEHDDWIIPGILR